MINSWRDHYWAKVPVMRTRIEETVRLVNGRGKRILEIGCNEGFLSKALQEDGGIVTAADISEEQIRKAKDIFGIEAVKADICRLPFEDQSFDIAVSGETIEHVKYPFKALNELFRVAREKIVISIPVGEYWMGEVTHQWEIHGRSINHDAVHVAGLEKDILLLCFVRRRDESFNDIAPFNTAELKKKYGIS